MAEERKMDDLQTTLKNLQVGDIQVPVEPSRAARYAQQDQYFGVQGIKDMEVINVQNVIVKRTEDSYNDFILWESVKQAAQNSKLPRPFDILAACVITMAINGYGNGNYGEAQCDGQIIDIKQQLIAFNVQFGLRNETKCTPDVITPKRLLRLFRKLIHDYLVEHKDVESYLYRKYLKNKKHREYIFTLAEHHIEQTHHADTLLAAYEGLDTRMLGRMPTMSDTGSFSVRARAVFRVRNINYTKELPAAPITQNVVSLAQ